jgi:hypothetical protein
MVNAIEWELPGINGSRKLYAQSSREPMNSLTQAGLLRSLMLTARLILSRTVAQSALSSG